MVAPTVIPVHHILDPSTGLPAPPVWRTVSVKGRAVLSWLAWGRLPSRLVATNGIVSCIAGWPDDAVQFEVSATR
jgi:thiamine biosynthesis lipoprotein